MNVYEVVTSRIVEALEGGVVPWRCPWRTEAPKNLVSGRDYRGVNVLLLASAPHPSSYWVTFRQALALKGAVKKGARGTPVVFFQKATAKEEKDDKKMRGFLRYYTVFNVSQCDGITAPLAVERPPFDPIVECERIVAGFAGRPRVQHGGGRACYIPAEDLVQMPVREAFASTPEYYSTLFHELVHATGAYDRLNRRTVTDPISFASHAYSLEELTAEIGASFLCAATDILNRTIENSAAYIRHWSRMLRREPSWIVKASSQAAKGADLILGKQATDAGDEQSSEAA